MTSENPEISVIVPAYNAEKYIVKCLESLIKQDFDSYEIIVVNDGSSDKTLSLCQTFAEAHKGISIIDKENGGVSSARNEGIMAAKGGYIAFCDVDDLVSESYLSELYSLSQKNGIVIGGFIKQLPYNITKTFVQKKKEVVDLKQFAEIFPKLFIDLNLINSPWAKLYSAKLLDGIFFDTGISVGEDLMFNLEYLKRCSKVAVSDKIIYYYNCLDASSSRMPHDNDIDMAVRVYRAVDDFCGSVMEHNSHREAYFSLCSAGLYNIQSLMDCDLPQESKKHRIKEWFDCPEFMESCSFDLEYSLHLKLFQAACRTRRVGTVRRYFWLKKMAKKLLRK